MQNPNQTTTSPSNGHPSVFPYNISDLLYWVIRRKDGTVVKFILADVGNQATHETVSRALTCAYPAKSAADSARVFTGSMTYDWCHHDPVKPAAVIEQEGNTVPLKLYVADAPGVVKEGLKFDYIIDCGDAIKRSNEKFFPDPLLTGNRRLAELLEQYHIVFPPPTVLKIEWWDRQAPDLEPEFWTALSKELAGNVITNCQGGHGRSGTAFVCLLMNYFPDYTPFDAIVQLRAIHCPRAIESKEQHKYIDEVGKYLGREPNALKVEEVKSYKDAWEGLTAPSAVAQRKLVFPQTSVK